MKLLTGIVAKIRENRRGQTLAEYVLIVSVVAVAAIGGYNAVGATVKSLVATIVSQL